MKFLIPLALSCGLAVVSAADATKPLYENNFEAVAQDSLPPDFLVYDGNFAVKQENGNKFLELPGAPLETYGVLFGPTEKEGVAVSARIFGTGKGRRFPAFAVGVNGAGGYKLQLSPSKKMLELYRGDSVKASMPFEWESGKWTRLRLQVRKGEGASWNVQGKVWADGAAEPGSPTIVFEDKEEPPPGRASVWGNPYAGTPIRFDDFVVSAAK
jgi:hypothetical protein